MAADAMASLVLDRFVSASSSADAHTSLESILQALKNNQKKIPENDEVAVNKDPANAKLPSELIWKDDEILGALRHVLHTGRHKLHDMQVPVDEGASLVCKIYMEMLQQDSKCPLLDRDETVLECLIDVISDTGSEAANDDDGSSVSMYTRVLALQLLTELCKKRGSKAQTQLLAAPNGLHRLGDLLNLDQEEILRNEALLLAQVVAEWPSCAQNWMLNGIGDHVMQMAMQEGGLTKGNMLVQDCLDLLFTLCKHAPKKMADNFVFESPIITKNLPMLLNLQRGTEYMNPSAKKVPVAKKDDDLDDILKNASAPESETGKAQEVVVPRLTESEEQVIEKTMKLLSLLMESESTKKGVWRSQEHLCTFIWDLALLNPAGTYFFSVPSSQLQQQALETVSLYFNDNATMENRKLLDGLLRLVCTGGTIAESLEEKMGVSQAALHVLRKTMPAEVASEMLMHTLAPPMSMGDDEDEPPPPPIVIHSLIATLFDGLTETRGVDPVLRQILLAGAVGGLSFFLPDQSSRELMLRIAETKSIDSRAPVTGGEPNTVNESDSNITTLTLIESIIQAIGKMEEEQNPENVFLSMMLLRFLCHWCVETPSVVQAILSYNRSSTVLSSLLGIKTKTHPHKKGVAVLGKLLLGLSMEFMGDDEVKCGGWTRATIMELLAKTSGGAEKITATLVQFKSVRDFGDSMPWSACDLEFKEWVKWFSKCVVLVQQRVIVEITAGAEGEEGSDGEGDELEAEDGQLGVPDRDKMRSLQKLVYQQSKDITDLNERLRKANGRLESQQNELSDYKRRVESAPSQLDSMLTEKTTKVKELENNISSLEEDSRIQQERHKAEVGDRDDRIRALQAELEESKQREKESRDETETLREEIQSLSQAYTGLEQQYREQQLRQDSVGHAAMISAERPVGQQELGGLEQNLHAGNGVGSTEVSTVRAENDRLRDDAQRAEEWMAMAVEKMQTFAQQNGALQTELLQLRESQSQGMNEQQRDLQQQYQALFEEKQSLIQHQNQLQSGLSAATQEKQHLQQGYSELEGQISRANEELHSTRTLLEESRSQAASERSELENRLGAMARDLENAGTEISRLQAELVQWQQQPQTDRNITNEQRAESMFSPEAASVHEPAVAASLTAEVEHLRSALEQQSVDARSEIETVRRHEQEEIYRREATIRELEDRLDRVSGGNGGSLVEEMKTKDTQIAELEASNEAAQEWMQKAISQFNMLTEQNTRMGSENAALIAEIRELKNKAAENETAFARASVLEQESMLQSSRLAEAEASLAACEVELEQAREDLISRSQSSEGAAAEVQQLRDEIETLKVSLQEQVSLREQLRAQLDSEETSTASLMEELASVKTKLNGGKAASEGAELESLREQAATLNASLAEKESTCEQLRTEIGALNSDAERRNTELQALRSKEARSGEMQTTLGVATKANNSTPTSQPSEQSAQDFFSNKPSSSAASETEDFFSGPPSVPSNGGTAPPQQPAMAANAHDLFSAAPALPAAATAHDFFGVSPVQSGDNAQEGNEDISQDPVVARLEATISDLRQELGNKEQGMEKQKEAIASLETRIKELESANLWNASPEVTVGAGVSDVSRSELEATQASLAEAMAKIEEDEHIVVKWEERVAELELAVKDLESQLAEQDEAANGVIEKWQESYAALETQNSELASSLEAPASAGETASSDCPDDSASSNAALQLELEQTKSALAEVEAKLVDDDNVVVKWEEQVAELETVVKDLKIELSEQEENAEEVIKKWQESCNALEEKNNELLQSLESSGSADGEFRSDVLSELQAKLAETENSLADARDALGNDDDVLLQWQERVAELEAALKNAEAQEEEAQKVLSGWQEACAASEEKNAVLVRSQEDSKAALSELQEKLQVTEQQLLDSKEMLNNDDNVNTLWQERVGELESTVKEQEKEANDVISKWEESYSALEEKHSELLAALEAKEHDSEALSSLQTRLDEAQGALDETKAKLSDGENAAVEFQERIVNMETTISGLEQQLSEKELETNSVVEQWQSTVTAIEGTKDELTEQLQKVNEQWQSTVTALEATKNELTEQLQTVNKQLESAQEEYSLLQTKVLEAEIATTESQEKLSQSEARVTELETATTSLENGLQLELNSLRESTASMEVDLKDRETALTETMQQVASAKTTVQEWEKRASELEATVSDLEEQLRDQELEASGVISQWETQFAELQKANAELTQSLAETVNHSKELADENDSLASLRVQLTEKEAALAEETKKTSSWKERSLELEAAVKEAEERLSEQEQEASSAISEWEAHFIELQTANEELTKSLDETFNRSKELADENDTLANSQAQLAEKEAALSAEMEKATNWKEQVAQMESMVKSLQERLIDNEKEASVTHEQLQRSIAEYQSKNTDLEDQLREAQESATTLQASITGKEDEGGELQALQASLDDARELLCAERENQLATEASLEESEDKVTELQTKLQDIEEQMIEKDKDMAKAVAEWQEHCVLLEKQNTALSDELEKAGSSAPRSVIGGDTLGNDEGEARIIELEATIKSLEQELDESEMNAADVINEWQKSYDQLQEANKKLESELGVLRESSNDGDIIHESITIDDDGNEVHNDESLNARIKELTELLRDREDELQTRPEKSVVEKLEFRCATNEKELAALTAQLGRMTEERDEANSSLRKNEEMTTGLRDEVRELEEQLEQQSAAADEAISSWEMRCTELQGNLSKVQSDFEACKAELLELLKAELKIHDDILTSYDHDFEIDFSTQDIAEAGEDSLRSKLRERNHQLGELLSKQDSDINALFVEMESLRSNEDDGQAIANNDGDILSSDEQLKSQIVDLQMQISDNETKIGNLEQLVASTQTLSSQMKDVDYAKTAVETEVTTLKETLSSKEESIKILESQIKEVGVSKSELQSEIRTLQETLATKEESMQSLASRVKGEELAKSELQSETTKLKEKLSLSLLAEEEAQLRVGDTVTEKEKLQESLAADQASFKELNARLSEALASEQETKSQLDSLTLEHNKLRESLNAENGEKNKADNLEKESATLKREKDELQAEVEQLKHQSSELEDELREANNAMQVYVAKEVSDRATEMATSALRQQLAEIRRQSDNDHASYLAEKEARYAAENEVARLRSNLHALVDVNEQEVEIYGADALVIKAGDKINRKERTEIADLNASLSRALADLSASRAGEKDAEERAAKAAHHVVVYGQDLLAAKSEVKYLIQTMDELRQDDESKRAHLENRIRSLENDLDVFRRFHSSETDSLRNELTKVAMEKDRTLQLLKDSERHNTAMTMAASKDYSSVAHESPEAELAKLRVEKAQLLVAAADEGAKQARRIREVLATESSSSEADVLVERERRLASEAACDNMKLLVEELQKEVSQYRNESFMAKSPSKMQVERDLEHVKFELERMAEENSSLQTKLRAAEASCELANTRLERQTADLRIAQATSSRLDREMKFQIEMQSELGRMKVEHTPAPKQQAEEKEKEVDLLPSVVDQLHQQSEAMDKERLMYRSLQEEHDHLLALLGQQQAVKDILEREFEAQVGQDRVNAVLAGAKASIEDQYGTFMLHQ